MLEGVGAAGGQDPFHWGFPPGVTAVVEVGARINMGIALQNMWMEGPGGFEYSNSVGSSQEQKEVHLCHASVCAPLLLFSTLEHVQIRKILVLVRTKRVFSPALFSGVEESF